MPTIAPALGLRPRLWVIGTILVTLGIDVVFFKADIEVAAIPGLWLVSLRKVVLTILAVSFVIFLLKTDRRAIGLTLGEPRTTLKRTMIQLLVLGALAIAYMIGCTVIARTTHFTVPVRVGNLEDASDFWEFLVLAMFAAPLYEEVLFRGMLTSALYWEHRKWATILISAAIFTLPHLLTSLRIVAIVGPFILGVLFAWSFLRTRSLITSFALHSIFNLGVLVKDLVILKNPGFIRRILGYE